MPRPPRLHVAGGCYHVMLRGNHRETLFGSTQDRIQLNQLVAEVIERQAARVLAFYWMTNHLHLLVQISDRPLGKLMHAIARRYSRYRHRVLGTTGHLFERRYKAKLVDVDDYLIALLRYIHLNPVAAGMVAHAADYRWSSHRAYLGLETVPWLDTEFGLGLFGTTLDQARIRYAQWMAEELFASEQRILDDTHPEDSRVLGGDRFLAGLPPLTIKPRGTVTVEQLAQQVCDQSGVSVELLRSRSRQRNLTPIRLALIDAALKLGIATQRELADFLGRTPTALSTLLARHQN